MVEDWRAENDRVQRLQGDALRRMKRASERGTGCTLTAEMIEALSRSTIGEWWHNLDEDGSSTL
ncbi:hypothetical protein PAPPERLAPAPP_02420 [Brevundimonas phage vB_BpoS-Papperlapapp]|uniref:Uncharacterized protein n=2 Tax=Marchewkavirus TaxID=3425052 RepID=A0A9E7SJR8_9CAUD|nr:hypothetical protein KABACHOK_00800 [Brevundimonas phage vB_BpoS-Kabachok]USN14613.1 hypothetical protein DOMOVOI_01390 [Brevundimonas phage vB_BpoS-Domovoi]USN15983.1 hypothetical protein PAPPERLAPAPP_02420 [Brevundimonas phage vB_BpoS-Papperlapapp]